MTVVRSLGALWMATLGVAGGAACYPRTRTDASSCTSQSSTSRRLLTGKSCRRSWSTADSGTPASGFLVTAAPSGGSSPAGGPVTLEPADDGHYFGVVDLSEGSWRIAVTAEQGGSAVPAKSSTRTFNVDVSTDGSPTVEGQGKDKGIVKRPVVWLAAGVGAVSVGIVARRIRARV